MTLTRGITAPGAAGGPATDLLDWKASVRVATTANITLSGLQTIDDVSVVAGDRVVPKNQTVASENGIYIAATGAWSRSTDADVDAEVTAGLAFSVAEGTVNKNTLWLLTTNDPITVGTTALTFVQFGTAPMDHGVLTGLLDDDHTQYALLAGRAGGQTLIGGTASGDDLTLQSTANATKGSLLFGAAGASVYDEVNDRLGLGTAAPNARLDVSGNAVISGDATVGLSSSDTFKINSVIDTDNAGPPFDLFLRQGKNWRIRVEKSTTPGETGGQLVILGGDGADGDGTNAGASGGRFLAKGGKGGAAGSAAGLVGGDSGNMVFLNSRGGDGSAEAAPGNGGDVTFTAGQGGLVGAFGGGGDGGDFLFNAGVSTGTGVNGAMSFGTATKFTFSNVTDNADIELVGSGRLGIGTPPDELLHTAKAVDGDAVLALLENSQANTAASVNETAQLRFGFGGNNDVARIVAGKEGDYTSGANENSFLALYTDLAGTATEAIRIASDGHVGINTTETGNALLVVATDNDTDQALIAFDEGPAGGATSETFTLVGLYSGGGVDNRLQLKDFNANTNMLWKADGTVGIGIDDPLARMHVQTTKAPFDNLADSTKYQFRCHNPLDTIGESTGISFGIDSGDEQTAAIVARRTGAEGQGELLFFTKQSTVAGVAPILAVTLDQSGNFGIGTATPTARLHVADGAKASAGEQVRFNLGTDEAQTLELAFRVMGDPVAANRFTEIQSIEQGVASRALALNPAGGNVGIGTTAPTSILSFAMGTGTGQAQASGKANVNTTAVGNVGTGEDDLMSFSLPANSLNADGKVIRIIAWGTTGANANEKIVKLFFGTAVVRQIGSAAINNKDWRIDAVVVRTGASAQDALGTEIVDNVSLNTHSEPAESTAAVIVIKTTGQGNVDNDVVQQGMLVEYLN